MNNNQQIGNINIVSGVPERVGMPVQVFKEVGAALTERYWQNKQMYDSITTSLKNMPTFDDTLDKKLLSEKSKMVDEKFKEVIDTDNFHNATATVMDVSKTLSTDEGIKALNYNVQQYNEQYKKMEEGFKDNPMWRTHIDTFKAITKSQYKGSVDENGKAVVARIFIPKTDMDISKETAEINDAVSKLKVFKSQRFNGTVTHSSDILNQIDNKYVRAAVQDKYQDKTTFETIDLNRIERAAMDALNADPDFNLKKQEIIQVNHFKNKGTLNVTKQDLDEVLDNMLPSTSKELFLSLSKSYTDAKKNLQIAYSNAIDNKDEKALKSINEKFKLLEKNKDIFYKEGQEVYSTGLSEDDITSTYYNLLSNKITDDIVKTTHKFEVNNVTTDRHYFTNGLSSVLSEQAKKNEESRVFTTAIESGVIGDIKSLFDPDSELHKTIKLKEIALQQIKNKKGATAEEIQKAQLEYDKANADVKSASDALYNTFVNLSKEDKEKVLKKAAGWKGINKYAFVNNNEILKQLDESLAGIVDAGEIVIKGLGKMIGLNTEYKEENSLVSQIQNYSKINPNDILKLSNEQLVKKYIKSSDTKVLSTYSNYFSKLKSELANAINETQDGRIIVHDYEIRGSGTPTVYTRAVRDNIINAAFDRNEDGFSKSLIDIKTGTFLQLPEGSGFSKIDKPDLDNINNNGEIEVTRIVSSRYPGKDVYKLSVPKRENVKGVWKNTGEFEEYTVAYDGNSQLSRQADISDLRNLGKVIKSHGLTDEIVSTAFQLSRRIANQMNTYNGTNYQSLANEIESDMARNPNLKKVYSFDLVPPDGNNRIRYHANVRNGQITLSLEQNGTESIVANNILPNGIPSIIGLSSAYNGGLDKETYDTLMKIVRNQ